MILFSRLTKTLNTTTTTLFSLAFLLGIGPVAVMKKFTKKFLPPKEDQRSSWEPTTGSKFLERMY